ncbi:hypothetical protein BN1723_009064, partial [Verticillium longisporum]
DPAFLFTGLALLASVHFSTSAPLSSTLSPTRSMILLTQPQGSRKQNDSIDYTMRTPQVNAAGRIVRRRAGVACIHCRKRKVRCDVSQRGAPCAICFLDDLDCQVRPRANRRNQNLSRADNTSQAKALSPSEACLGSPRHAHLSSTARTAPIQRGRPIGQDKQDSIRNHVFQDDTAEGAGNANASSSREATDEAHSLVTDGCAPRLDHELGALFSPSARRCSDVLYTHHCFLNFDHLPKLPVRDVNVLEAQGCLRVATRSILDEFVEQYFRHVHPFLPILHEGDFWGKYCDSMPSGTFKDGVSLLLLQAMLFASCNFVSLSTLRALGYDSMQSARAELYRKAKLLYDLGGEPSSEVLGQSSLLLSFSYTPEDPRSRQSNTSWLRRAINHARLAAADPDAVESEDEQPAISERASHGNVLKRLWWSCIMRDRVIALALRRQALITKETLDLQIYPGLEAKDLLDEVHKSKVYDSDTKKELIEVTCRLSSLCIIVTDLLSLMASQKSDKSLRPSHDPERDAQRTLRLEKDLQSCSALALLSQNSIVRAMMATSPPKKPPTAEGFRKLQYAVSCFTDCMQGLTEMRLVRWLPMSTVLPLMIYTVNSQTGRHPDCPCSEALGRDRLRQDSQLSLLTEAMNTIGAQYGGITWFGAIARRASELAQPWALDKFSSDSDDGVALPLPSTEPFLRLVITADLSLSTGNCPERDQLSKILNLSPKSEEPRIDDVFRGYSYAMSMNPTDILSWTELDNFLTLDWATPLPPENAVINLSVPELGDGTEHGAQEGLVHSPDLTPLSVWTAGESTLTDSLSGRTDITVELDGDLMSWGSG